MGFRDRRSAGRPQVVPYVPGEDSGDRHDRRLRANLEMESDAAIAAHAIGLKLRIANAGNHWMFTKDGFVADWWPSSAKLVVNKRWSRGVHCHDWQQALREIEKQMPKGGAKVDHQ